MHYFAMQPYQIEHWNGKNNERINEKNKPIKSRWLFKIQIAIVAVVNF